MIQKVILDGLKQVNVSADKEKTKVRVGELWKSVPTAMKHQVLSESGVAASTVYRILHQGSITPKVVVVMASVMEADPFYITGESEENTGFSDQLLERFLNEKGYGNLLNEATTKPKRKYNRRISKATEQQDAVSRDTTDHASDAPDESGSTENIDNNDLNTEYLRDVNEDELVLLLKALLVRSKRGKNAKLRLHTLMDILYED